MAITAINAVSALLTATQDGHVARINDAAGGFPTFTDVSPTSGQRADIGDVIKLVLDPRNSRRGFLYGTQNILVANNIQANTVFWQPVHSVEPGITNVDNGDGTSTFTADFTVSQCGFNIDKSYLFAKPNPMTTEYIPGEGFKTSPQTAGLWYHAMARERMLNQDIEVKTFRFTYSTSPTPPLTSSTAVTVGLAVNNGLGPHFMGTTAAPRGNNLTVTFETTDYYFGGHYPLTSSDSIGFWARDIPGGEDDGCVVCFVTMNRMEIVYYNGNVPFTLDNQVLISDFQPSSNRKDTYYWLSKRTVNSTDYVYFNATFDNFANVQNTEVAKYSDDMVYGIAQAPNGLLRTIWVTAGDPNDTDKGIYESRDLGVTFTKLTSYTLVSGGGAIYMPRQLTGRAPVDTDLIVIRGLDSGDLLTDGIGANDTDIVSATGILSNQAIHTCGYDGNLINVGVTTSSGNKLVISSDGGDTWTDKSLLSGNEIHCLTGFGNDSNYLAIGGESTLAFSLNRGTNWTDLWSDFSAWATGWDTKVVTVIPSTPPSPTHQDAYCPICNNSTQP